MGWSAWYRWYKIIDYCRKKKFYWIFQTEQWEGFHRWTWKQCFPGKLKGSAASLESEKIKRRLILGWALVKDKSLPYDMLFLTQIHLWLITSNFKKQTLDSQKALKADFTDQCVMSLLNVQSMAFSWKSSLVAECHYHLSLIYRMSLKAY